MNNPNIRWTASCEFISPYFKGTFMGQQDLKFRLWDDNLRIKVNFGSPLCTYHGEKILAEYRSPVIKGKYNSIIASECEYVENQVNTTITQIKNLAKG